MPYNPAQAGRTVVVQRVELFLDVSPSPPWTGGQTLTLTAILTSNGMPVPGARIRFLADTILLGEADTNTAGVATVTAPVPREFMCASMTVVAVDVATGTESNRVSGSVAYPTRISISAPSTVSVGQPFTITGKLEFMDKDGAWKGLAGRTVSLYYNNTKIRDVTTGSDGSYSASATITTPGTYTLKAVYAGEGLPLTAAELMLHVLSTPWISLIPIAAGSAAILLVK